MAPQRPVLNQLRRTEEALAAAVERLGGSSRPALAMETPRTQKPGRWAAVRRSRRHPRRTSRLSRRGPGHGPRRTSTGSQVARDGSNAWYSSRYGYMSELENRKRRGPLRGPSRRIAPGASRPPVEACAQTHGNAVTVPLWPVAPQPNGWDHPGTCPGVYQAGIRPRGAAWGPHEPRIRGVGVWGGLGPM